ncbi:MAG: hypothetical protein NBKEAIPA_02496 [Nitrospirae bacterium]|nr:MAG: hypothetical protein UZ03_NOB001002861 [Nitrospira sp. OLB3]MBV6470580.1 hypothetical protein [Nitrospirota bacterium]MCE7965400.1 hypothetical protein [Nitrospira sp. NTP2]MCK6493024.1 hypothetical protein [Nitrospira sp.]MEB2338371.1 hypothetical protein [Nitrospirales bacterium]
MWPHVATSVIGVWLVASPDLLQYAGAARMNNQVVGAWMATFGLIAASESVRPIRWINVVLGTWLLVAPFLLAYPDERACGSLAAGIAAIALSLIRGAPSERFGGGWTALWKEVSQ